MYFKKCTLRKKCNNIEVKDDEVLSHCIINIMNNERRLNATYRLQQRLNESRPM